MTNAEILLLIKPVLKPELYTAIEAVFERESKLSKAASLIDSALTKSKPSYEDQLLEVESRIDAYRSSPKFRWED